MNEEAMKILKMVEDKKITSEEAAKLLDAIEDKEAPPPGKKNKMLRVRVYEADGRSKVNVNVPLGLAKFAMKFIPKHAKDKMGESNVDFDSILQQIETQAEGKLVDIVDERKGERVEVYIE